MRPKNQTAAFFRPHQSLSWPLWGFCGQQWCPFPIGWLIFFAGVWRNPLKTQASLMIDGIPNRPRNMFTKRTLVKLMQKHQKSIERHIINQKREVWIVLRSARKKGIWRHREEQFTPKHSVVRIGFSMFQAAKNGRNLPRPWSSLAPQGCIEALWGAQFMAMFQYHPSELSSDQLSTVSTIKTSSCEWNLRVCHFFSSS